MNEEQSRLDTFSDWPQDAVVSPTRIAKAGFFSTRQDLTVECFSCHATISEWNYGDQVMARHRSLSPNCSFVLNPSTSDNVPIIPSSIPSSSVAADMKEEEARLQTFESWPVPHIVSAEALSRAGFYYLKTDDNTKCAFCKGVVRAWEPGDDPDKEHRRYFENCPYVQLVILPRLTNVIPNINLVGSPQDLHGLGVQAHKGPKKPNYGTVESRLKTFTSWPRDLIQTPEILSQAGFYYEGPPGDQVRCFHCFGGLRHWDPQDDPWTEHARWFPRCSFIKLVKGQDFVNACSLELNVNSNLEEVTKKISSSGSTSNLRRREISDRELQEHLTSEAALSALSIGLNVERVKQAIREKLEQTGRGYSQPDALVEAALNLQHDEEDSSTEDQNESSGIGRHVKNVLENLVMASVDSANPVARNLEDGDKTHHVETNAKLEKSVSLEEENRLLKEARLCKICMDVEVGIVFLPCGHLATCVNCAPNLEDCPVCRSSIKATVRTFLS